MRSAIVGTVGINPSNKEFVSRDGVELDGPHRRLPTLRSLDMESWKELSTPQLRQIFDACSTYFQGVPYDRWFQVLERILAPSDTSLYRPGGGACHLDLVPYATQGKWGSLSLSHRRTLLNVTRLPFAHLLRDSNLEVLVLNGRSVLNEFERISETVLMQTAVPRWDLPRANGVNVKGLAYTGELKRIAGVDLGRSILVLGYNHNLQSSYGVTAAVMSAIGTWLADQIRG
ncbi:hypothetical protein [Micromonospora sp. NPDC004704]